MSELKHKQRDLHDQKIMTGVGEYVGNEFHDYFRKIPFDRIRRFLENNHICLDNCLLHVAGAGTGIDAFYLKQFCDPDFFFSDISGECVRLCCERHGGQGSAADMENLPFEDDFFEWSFVASSLHHLPFPTRGLSELLRVSRKGVLVLEPHDSVLTRTALRLGRIQEYETGGNYVYRFNSWDLERFAKAAFVSYQAESFFTLHRVAKSKAEFRLLKAVNWLANKCIPFWGSQILFMLQKGGRGQSSHLSIDRGAIRE